MGKGVLRIYPETAVNGLRVHAGSDVGWMEENLTWSNRPMMGALLGAVDIAAGEWDEVAGGDVILRYGERLVGAEGLFF